MTDAAIARLMERQCNVALRTTRGVPAGAALHVRGKPPTIQEEHDLAATRERPLDAGHEAWAHSTQRSALRVAKIDGKHGREL